MKKTSKRRVLVFIVILTALSMFAHFSPLESNWANLVIMWSPGIAAIITALSTGLSLKSFGWKLPLKWTAAGWIIPISYGFITYGIIWLTGLGDMPKPTFLERSQLTMGFNSDSNILIITAAFFFITLVNLLPNAIFTLGEELGWRGFLVPQLSKFSSFGVTALVSGIIWAAWHLPGILSGNYGAAGTPLFYQVFCFLILVLSGSVILAWLRISSGSIWPAVVFHATHNGVIQAFFERITVDNGNLSYFGGEFGILLPLVSLIYAIYFYKKATATNLTSLSNTVLIKNKME